MSLSDRTPETSAVIVPPFIKMDPLLWFHMLESTFELATPKPITESKTKYNYVVAHLPPDIATVVRDIIMQPDGTDPYLDLKKKVIERCSESRSHEIRRLLAGESLGDRKPTELLREMKRRAESHKLDDTLLLELFNQAMPVSVQAILASISPLTSEKAAEVADRILEVHPSNIHAVSCKTTSPTHANADEENSAHDLLAEVKQLRKEVAQLRSRSRHRGNSSTRSRSKSCDNKNKICWYHFKFKENAKKCFPPCSYPGNDIRKE